MCLHMMYGYTVRKLYSGYCMHRCSGGGTGRPWPLDPCFLEPVVLLIQVCPNADIDSAHEHSTDGNFDEQVA